MHCASRAPGKMQRDPRRLSNNGRYRAHLQLPSLQLPMHQRRDQLYGFDEFSSLLSVTSHFVCIDTKCAESSKDDQVGITAACKGDGCRRTAFIYRCYFAWLRRSTYQSWPFMHYLSRTGNIQRIGKYIYVFTITHRVCVPYRHHAVGASFPRHPHRHCAAQAMPGPLPTY